MASERAMREAARIIVESGHRPCQPEIADAIDAAEQRGIERAAATALAHSSRSDVIDTRIIHGNAMAARIADAIRALRPGE